MGKRLQGMFSALATAFTKDGTCIDESAERELVDGMIAAGVHGLIPCGSTGEFAALSHEERKRVVEVVIEQARGRVPVVPQTGATTTREAIELSKHAEELGADGVMVVHPYYEPLSFDEVFDYFQEISNAIQIPIMVYNIPSCTGKNLDPAFLARLCRGVENVKYVKDSSGDLSQFSELFYKYRDDVTAFNGWDTITFPGLALGAKGGVWGACNAMPRQCANLFNLTSAGKLTEARALWDKMWPVMQFLGAEGYLASVKAGANLVGFRVGNPRLPYRPLSNDKVMELKTLLVNSGTL